MNADTPQLILASTSPYRCELLERLAVSFETVSPEVDEIRNPVETAESLVMRLSESKARAGAIGRTNALVIGSDQVAVCDNEILGKPGNHENACQQLNRLSGRRVSFYTGLCLYDTRTTGTRVDLIPFHVTFRSLSEAQIERYLHTEQPYNCAGSFKSEGLGISLFESMQGEDPSALIGLPLIRLVTWLNEAGISVP